MFFTLELCLFVCRQNSVRNSTHKMLQTVSISFRNFIIFRCCFLVFHFFSFTCCYVDIFPSLFLCYDGTMKMWLWLLPTIVETSVMNFLSFVHNKFVKKMKNFSSFSCPQYRGCSSSRLHSWNKKRKNFFHDCFMKISPFAREL